ncbi:MAG: hypothetical protein VKO64_07415 [Candidatus Sericytochromatia bacterium]|nr:hypothetical protein [Candidatus Sericytochromatia bacterium]
MGAVVQPDGSQGRMTVTYMDPMQGEKTVPAKEFFDGVSQVTIPLGLRHALKSGEVQADRGPAA